MIGEQLLRAGAAVLAGLSIAWDHLRDHDDQVELVVKAPCPDCGASLADGPHFHDNVIVWTTEHEGAYLITDLRGRTTAGVPGADA